MSESIVGEVSEQLQTGSVSELNGNDEACNNQRSRSFNAFNQVKREPSHRYLS